MGTLGNQHLPFDPVRTSGLPRDAERFSGDNSTTDFELSYVVHSTTDIAVFVENVRQEPTTAYTVVGKTIEFTEAPPTGSNNIYVVFNHANPEIFGSVPDGSIGLDKLADTNFLQKRNIVINGGMNVWQRSTSTASITTSAYHTVDRWQTSIDTLGTWTQSRSTDVPSGYGFGYSLKMDCTTANASPAAGNYMLLQTKFEGQDLQYLKKGTTKAESVTVSFWVKSNKTGTYIVELFDQDNTRQISKSYTINVASTWEKKTLTFSGDTTGAFDNDNGDSLNLVFWLGAGSTYTGGTLNTAWASNTNANRAVGQVNLADNTANEWFVTGVQMETGTYASPFEFEKYSEVLRKCLRYFERYEDGVQTEDGGMPQGYCQVDVANRPETSLIYTRKRSSPTITGSSAVQFFHAGNSNVTTTGGPNTFVGTGLSAANLFYTCSSGVSVNSLSGIGYISLGTGDFINIDAEL